MRNEPKTLQQAISFFNDAKNAREYAVDMRWPDGVVCPKCGSQDVLFLEKYERWHCRAKHVSPQFTLKTGTIMEDSPIALGKWLMVMWMLVNCRNGISSYEVSRDIGITQKSAWFLLHRVRNAMRGATPKKIGGQGNEIEADEAFIGGKDSNKHERQRRQLRLERKSADLQGSGHLVSKTAVMGMLDREQRKVRAEVVPAITRLELQTAILNHLMPGSKLYTDQAKLYRHVPKEITHSFVNHMKQYVDGRVHTNGIENFWSLLKRSLNGSYVAVEPFHLSRYVDEQVFRYNHRKDGLRKLTETERFNAVLAQVVGRRLTYRELTGKEGGLRIV
jgi:ISXO2 transposase-like protein/transposase-like zinc ribbon protein